MTFVRPIFESTVRAGWVLGCATDDQVDAVRHDDAFRFPVMKDMAVAVETRFNPRAIFTTYVTDNWATLNSYTHPGLRQLTARFSKIDVSPEYPPQHVVVAINGSMNKTARLFTTHSKLVFKKTSALLAQPQAVVTLGAVHERKCRSIRRLWTDSGAITTSISIRVAPRDARRPNLL